MRQLLLRKLMRGGAGSLLVKIGAAVFSFLMFLVIARGMTPADYGLFGFGFSVATLMVLAGSLGQRMSAVRYIPVYLERADAEQVRGFTRRGYLLVLGGTAVLSLLYVAVSSALPGLTGGLFAASVAVFTVMLALAEYQSHVLRGHGSVVLALAPREVIWRGLVILLFSVPALGLTGLIPVSAAFLMLAALFVPIILIQAAMHPATRAEELVRAPARTTDSADWNASAKVYWATSILRAATANVAVILVGLTMTPEEAGAYFAAFRLAMLLNLVMIAADMLAYPLLSASHERGDSAATRTICRFVVIAASIPAGLGFVAFVIWGDLALSLYAPEFSDAHGILVIIAGGYLLGVVTGPTNGLLQMKGEEKTFLTLSLCINGALVIALPLLIWAFGMTGAAVATGLELALTGIFGAIYCRRRFGLDPSLLGLLRKGRHP